MNKEILTLKEKLSNEPEYYYFTDDRRFNSREKALDYLKRNGLFESRNPVLELRNDFYDELKVELKALKVIHKEV